MGGLSKKAYQIEQIRSQAELPSLTLDAGNLLFKDSILPGQREQATATAAGIVDAYSSMAYDAVGVGWQDLAGGLDFLKSQAGRSHFQWLSANLLVKATGQPVLQGQLIKQVGNIKVGIIGLTGPQASRFLTDDAVLAAWQDVLPAALSKLAAASDMIILLSNNTTSVNQVIAKAHPEIRLIIQASPAAPSMSPELHNGTLFCQTGKQGKYLGNMTLHWRKSGLWGTDTALQKLAGIKGEIDGITGRLKRYESRLSETERTTHKPYTELMTRQQQLTAEQKEILTSLREQEEAGTAPSTFDNHFITLEAGMPDQPEVKKIVENLQKKINELGSMKSDDSATDEPQDLSPLVGWKKCAGSGCHEQQTAFWQTTGHAEAYKTLETDRQNFNLDCLPCHVTFQQITEATPPALVARLANLPSELQLVGCESCHGAGEHHAASPSPANTMTRTPPQSTCLACHTEDHDDNFQYQDDLRKIGCPLK